jgi:hypothetical protein
VVDLYAETFDDPARADAYRYGEAIVRPSLVRGRAGQDRLGFENRVYELRRTHPRAAGGVRDGKPLAVRMAKLEEGGQLEERMEMARARSLHEFEHAMERLAVPLFNTLYATAKATSSTSTTERCRVVRRARSRLVEAGRRQGSVDGVGGLPCLLRAAAAAQSPLRLPQNCNSTPFLAAG